MMCVVAVAYTPAFAHNPQITRANCSTFASCATRTAPCSEPASCNYQAIALSIQLNPLPTKTLTGDVDMLELASTKP